MKNDKILKNGGILGIISGALIILGTIYSFASIEQQVEQYGYPELGSNTTLVRIFGLAVIALSLALLYCCTKAFEQINKDKRISKLSTVFLMISGVMLLVFNTSILDSGIAVVIVFFDLLLLISGILGIIGGMIYLINLKDVS